MRKISCHVMGDFIVTGNQYGLIFFINVIPANSKTKFR